MARNEAFEQKVRELQLRALRSRQSQLSRGNDYVPGKKKSKPLGYKLQNTFEKNLRGVPGGSMARGVTASIIKMVAAPSTGTQVRKEGIGVMRSARNANTTQGGYNRSIVRDEDGNVSSDAQGRKVFGR
jgi:hypothetical protein